MLSFGRSQLHIGITLGHIADWYDCFTNPYNAEWFQWKTTLRMVISCCISPVDPHFHHSNHVFMRIDGDIHLVLSKCRTLRIWLTSVILPLLLAIVSSVWFYIRLYRLSGSFTGTQPEWSSTHLGRNTHLNFTQALFDKDFYISSFAQYQNSSVTGLRYGWLLVIALTFLPLFFGFVACIVTLFKKRHFRQTFQSDASIFIMLVLALAGTTFQQLLFFKQGGNPNAVYFSLISIVFALFIAYGFSLFPRWWAAALSIWLALRGFAFALEIHIRWPFSSEGTMAGASQYWVWLTLAGIITVCLGTFIAIIASAKGRKFSPLPLTAFGIATE